MFHLTNFYGSVMCQAQHLARDTPGGVWEAGGMNWTSEPGADESKCGGGGAVGSGGWWRCPTGGRQVARLLSNNHTCCSHRPRAFQTQTHKSIISLPLPAKW